MCSRHTIESRMTMSHTLYIATSPADATASQSRQKSATLLADITGSVTTRDLALTPLPQVTAAWNAARLVPAADRSAAENETLTFSNTLVADVLAADHIIIDMPMYNFGLPAALKAWIDLICRPKETFAYTSDSPVGLLDGKRATIVAASGGVPIGASVDFATPHLKTVLGFIGITDVTVILSDNTKAAEA